MLFEIDRMHPNNPEESFLPNISLELAHPVSVWFSCLNPPFDALRQSKTLNGSVSLFLLSHIICKPRSGTTPAPLGRAYRRSAEF